MPRFALRLPQHQARLVALAVSYHLSRPGSELDPDTLGSYEHGLAEVQPEIEPQLGYEHAVLELSPLQMVLLSTALSSVISELKMYSVFDTMSGSSERPRSTAAGFDERLKELFPELRDDPAYASQLAEDMMMLRRRLPGKRAQEALEAERRAEEEAAQKRKKWWEVWKRR